MAPTKAQHAVNPMDSVEIGLLTCSPHDEVYSLYGHSAIHLRDYRDGTDIVFSYGVFNYNKPHFVLRFVCGLTDYELGVYHFSKFCKEYTRWNCKVTEQVLNLTPDEKARIANALFENAQPENRVYRYNFFYDNCSTRPRDIIEENVNGKVVYKPLSAEQQKTYRQFIHEHTKNNPWSAFGNDLLLGVRADKKTTLREQQFLPENLENDFKSATIEQDGYKRPLVKEEIVWYPLGTQPVGQASFPLSPLFCMFILLAITIGVFAYEQYKKTCLQWFDATLMLLTGLAGIILFVMFFSEHPATSTNLQILILNPLSLFFIPTVLRRRKTRWFSISLCLTLLFLIGAFWQDYAEGMEVLALCLLSRYLRHRYEK